MQWQQWQAEPNWMFLAGVVLASFVLIRLYLIRSRRARNSAIETPRQPDFRRGQFFASAPPQAVQWQVEMHEIARETKAELDSKMRALQVLLRDAQQCESRLRELVERLEITLKELSIPKDDHCPR